MDFNSARQIVDRIEEDLDVNSIKFNSKTVWPIIKYRLFFGLLKFENEGKTERKSNASTYNPSFTEKIRAHIKNGKCFVFNLVKQQTELKKLGNIPSGHEILFLDVTDAGYVDSINSKRYSRYISPYLEFIESKYKTLFLNVSELPSKHDKLHVPFFFNCSYFVLNARLGRYYAKKAGHDLQVKNFHLLSEGLRDIAYSGVLAKELLTEDLSEISAYEKMWGQILKKISPKVVVLKCYYGNNNYYGMISATKKLNIKVVDLQHGISAAHMYVGWSKSPSGGYEYLPDYYWCWSRYDLDFIKQSRQGSEVLKPVLGGNLWFGKNLAQKWSDPESVSLQKKILEGNYKKIILVTLQHSIPVSEILLDAIKNSPKVWLWLVRFHPLDFVDPEYRKTYITEIKDLSNVEYEKTTAVNLYFLLKNVSIHVTHHSTCAIEALSLGIPTILLGEKFAEIFAKFIETGNFYVANSGSDVVKLVNSGISINNNTCDYFKIETSAETANEVLKSILK